MSKSLPPHEIRVFPRVAIVVLLLLGITAGAFAHDTWLLPSSLRVPVGRAVTLNLTSGEAFPVDDFAIEPTRVVLAEARLGGVRMPLGKPRRTSLTLRYVWRPTRAGIAALALELAPKSLELSPPLVAEYLNEINAEPGIRAAWDRMPGPKRWRESYVKHAVTYIRVGAPRGDTSWKNPLGLALELVPERDPTELHAGDTLQVRVLRHGRPLGGFAVGAQRASVPTVAFTRTDSEGRARICLPSGGLWLLKGTDLQPASRPGLEWESDFATVTLAVQPGHLGARDTCS
ncbi:MAG: hypothetical protein NVS4B3_23260 [Gemmatimonadaceae bacterium]